MPSRYPVSVEVDYVHGRSRWKTFLRYLLVLPWSIWGAILAVGLFVVTVVAWVAIIVTGRYPEGLYAFAVRAFRYTIRVNGYTTLLTDAWPPFDLDEHPDYPVRVQFAPQPERQSRLTVFFRGLLAIPLYIVSYVYSLIAGVAVFVAWLVGVFAGSQPEGLQKFLVGYVGYGARLQAYYLLLRDEYPPILQFGSEESPEPVGADRTHVA